MDQNQKYIRRIDEHSIVYGVGFLNRESIEEGMVLKRELKIIKSQMNRLMDIIIHQHNLTREFF